MLTSLRIVDFGVISDATINPAPGMTALTGETGAGKTLVVAGLGMLLGERAETTRLRSGAKRASIEGRFTEVGEFAAELDELGSETEDDELLAVRQLTEAGRSRAMLGGVSVPVTKLRDLVGELATIHGQSEQVRLSTPQRQRQMLDQAGGTALLELVDRYHRSYLSRSSLQTELEQIRAAEQARAREADLLRFGLAEIAAVDPNPDEDTQLGAEAHRLEAVDELRQLAQSAQHALAGAEDGDWDDPGASGLLGQATKSLGTLAGLDPAAEALGLAAQETMSDLSALAGAVSSYLSDLEADPTRLEAITARRAELQKLTRKYGTTIAEVLEWATAADAQLAQLGAADQRGAQLAAEISKLDAQLAQQAAEITALRQTAAEQLASATQAELAPLAMPAAQLRFVLQPSAELGPWGAETVQLLFAANPGGVPVPIGKVASGGELSRIRLALEVVLAGTPGHTFVFDEVDAGIGGAVGLEIGARLARLAQHSQVIVVTHLAQVAAFADKQYVVTKTSEAEVTSSDVVEVEGADRVAELARMMAGLTSSPASLEHAAELLEQAQSQVRTARPA